MRQLTMRQFDRVLASLEVCVDNAVLLNEMLKLWEVIFDRFREGWENRETALFMANSSRMLDLIDLVYEL